MCSCLCSFDSSRALTPTRSSRTSNNFEIDRPGSRPNKEGYNRILSLSTNKPKQTLSKPINGSSYTNLSMNRSKNWLRWHWAGRPNQAQKLVGPTGPGCLLVWPSLTISKIGPGRA